MPHLKLQTEAAIETRPARARPSSHYAVVDGLRGLAAVLVFIYHIALYKNLQPSNALGSGLVNHTYLAVDLFFVISGFVIAYAFDDKISKGLSFPTFFKLRVIRLYPMVLLGLGLGLSTLIAIHLAFPAIPGWRFFVAAAMNAFLLPTTALTAAKPYVFPINSVFWSLSFEMIMYIAYFATRRLLNGTALLSFVALAALMVVFACHNNNTLNVGFDAYNYAWGFARVTYSFFAGVLIRRKLIGTSIAPNSCYLSIPLLFIALTNPIPASGLYDGTAVIFLLPLSVFLAIQAGHYLKLNQISKILGEISYPLYAIHIPLVLIFTHLTPNLHLSGAADFALTLTFTISTITLAYYLNRLYDAPVRQALTKLNLGF